MQELSCADVCFESNSLAAPELLYKVTIIRDKTDCVRNCQSFDRATNCALAFAQHFGAHSQSKQAAELLLPNTMHAPYFLCNSGYCQGLKSLPAQSPTQHTRPHSISLGRTSNMLPIDMCAANRSVKAHQQAVRIHNVLHHAVEAVNVHTGGVIKRAMKQSDSALLCITACRLLVSTQALENSMSWASQAPHYSASRYVGHECALKKL